MSVKLRRSMSSANEILKSLREMFNNTITEKKIDKNTLCKSLRISRSYLNKLLSGTSTNISLQMLGKIADTLEVSFLVVDTKKDLTNEKEKSISCSRGTEDINKEKHITSDISDPNFPDVYRSLNQKGLKFRNL